MDEEIRQAIAEQVGKAQDQLKVALDQKALDLFTNDAEKHRLHLETQLSHLKWAAGTIFSAGTAVAGLLAVLI